MKKWELEMLLIPLPAKETQLKGKLNIHIRRWGDLSDFPKEFQKKAGKLANEGYELVNAVPIIEGHEFEASNGGLGSSYTSGVILFFKRPTQ